MYKLGLRSKKNLQGVNPKLAAIVLRAIEITEQDFAVIEGRRSKKRQRPLKKAGKTWTLNSKHIKGNAVDLAAWVIVDGKGQIDWNDVHRYVKIKDAMFQSAAECGVKIRWGGDWNRNGDFHDEIKRGSFDGVHFELLEE